MGKVLGGFSTHALPSLIKNYFMIRHLRSWTTGSTERTWAVAIALACFSLFIILLFFSGEKSAPKVENATKEAVKTNKDNNASSPVDASAQAVVTNVEKKQGLPIHAKDVKKESVPVKDVKPMQHQVRHPIAHKEKQPSALPVYFIQAGAFQKEIYAQKLRERLADKHWSVRIHKKKQLYAVQIGPYKSKKSAEAYKNKLSQQEKINGFIIYSYANKK